MIVKRKLYSDFGQVISAGVLGSIFGFIPGAIVGSLIGGERGARIGALIGSSALGLLSGAMEYKHIKDEEKAWKSSPQQKKLIEEFTRDPEMYLKKIFSEEKKLYLQYNEVLRKYDKSAKFPVILEKYLNIREQFIPTILEWIEKFDVSDPGIIFEIMLSPISSKALDRELKKMFQFIDDWELGERNCVILVNPGREEDYQVCNPWTGKFGSYFSDPAKIKLGNSILDSLRNKEDEFKKERNKEALWLLDKYRRFIQVRL